MTVNRTVKTKINICILLAVVVFIFTMAYKLRSIFNPILLSLVLAYILDPVITLFEQIKVKRSITIFAVYIVLTAIIITIFLFLIPLIGSEISYFYRNAFEGDAYVDLNNNGQWDWIDANDNNEVDEGEEAEPLTRDHNENKKYDPSYLSSIIKGMRNIIQNWNEKNPTKKIEKDAIMEFIIDSESIKANSKTLFNLSLGTFKAMFSTVLSLFSIMSYFILLPLYTFFILRGFHGMGPTIYDYIPEKNKQKHIKILEEIQESISSFFRGKIIICIIKGLITWGLLSLFGLKYGLIFGIVQAVVSIVPFLVLLVGMIPNLAVVMLDKGMHFPYLFLIVFIYAIIEVIEGFLLTPWIVGQKTSLHPVTVILSLLIGGKLFGLFGLIIAVPLCTTLKILSQEYLIPIWHDLSGCTAGAKPCDNVQPCAVIQHYTAVVQHYTADVPQCIAVAQHYTVDVQPCTADIPPCTADIPPCTADAKSDTKVDAKSDTKCSAKPDAKSDTKRSAKSEAKRGAKRGAKRSSK